MSAVSRAADLYFAYKFLRALTTPWEDTPAYRLGVVDANGKRVVASRDMTPAQRSAWGPFDRLAYNLKRLIGAVPGGSSSIATYTAALALLRESHPSVVEGLRLMLEEAPVSSVSNIDRTPTSRPKKGQMFRRKLTSG